MEKKTYTFLVMSNRRGRSTTLTVSAAWLKAMAFLGGVVAILVVAVGVDYAGLLLKEAENKSLKVENSQLTRQLKVIESKVVSLENGLERVKNFETKLKLITNINPDVYKKYDDRGIYDKSIKDEDRALKLSMGPMPTLGMHEANALDGMEHERGPTSEYLEKDAVFMEKAPLDEARGEIGSERTRSYASLSIRIDRAVSDGSLIETGVMDLYNSLNERRSLMNATPSVKPTRGWYTSRFGYRVYPFTGKPVMHKGLDIAATPGTPVYAPADGIVSYVAYEPGYGKIIAIDHGYGVKTRFAHNSQVFVERGQKVSRYDVISAVGNTGRSSGPHLHYEVRVHDVPVDPINYILDIQ